MGGLCQSGVETGTDQWAMGTGNSRTSKSVRMVGHSDGVGQRARLHGDVHTDPSVTAGTTWGKMTAPVTG